MSDTILDFHTHPYLSEAEFLNHYPICNPRMYVQAVYQEPLSTEDRENILHKNAERILGIGESGRENARKPG